MVSWENQLLCCLFLASSCIALFSDGSYIIADQSNNMVLSLQQESDGFFYIITVPKNTADPYQLWYVDELSGGEWGYIFNKANGLVMDVLYANTDAGAKVIVYPQNFQLTNGNQQWKYQNGYIISRLNNLVMEVENGNNQANAKIVMGTEKNANYQRWNYEDVNYGMYTLCYCRATLAGLQPYPHF